MSNPADRAIDAVHLHNIIGAHNPTARELQEGRHLLALAAEEDPPPLWPNLTEAVDLNAIDEYALAAADNGDVEQLAHALVDLDTIRLRIALAIQVVEDALVPLMTTKTLEVAGLPVLEARGGKARKAWHTDDLVRVVVRKALDDMVDDLDLAGLPEDASDAVAAAIQALTTAAPFTPSMGWRVSALRAMDIDPDDYCETSPGRWSIQIHRTNAEAVTP